MDAESIFNAVGRLGQLSVIADQRQKKLVQIRELEAKKCGNCDHWMKSSCKPEKEQKQFKSCNAIACKDFILKGWVAKMKNDRIIELKEIESKLDSVPT